jgi:hypothetical protein
MHALVLALCLAAPASPDLSADDKSKAIDQIVQHLRAEYVFPELAETMSKALAERRAAGAYDAIRDADAFAQQLTDDLQGISHDKHLRVRAEGQKPSADPKHAPFPRTEEEFRRRNFGFEKVELLPGNIGYVDLRMFASPELAGETAAAAMSFLANADALVIDLRKNGGGSPDMVQLFCSYLFPPEPVHLNDLYFRPADETRQFWTHAWLPGRRFAEKDVYVLTSSGTFSGAEECAYDLKTQKRATIVGETTGGGAHPGGNVPVGPGLTLFVPSGRAINPVTKTDWEGTGVEPDVKVSADLALATAQKLALEKLVEGCKDEARKSSLEGALAELASGIASAKAAPAAAPQAK